MWDNISLIVNEKRPLSNIEKLQHDGKQYHQSVSIFNALNIYFRDIPSYLASKLPKTNGHFTSYPKKNPVSVAKQSMGLKFFYFLKIFTIENRLV